MNFCEKLCPFFDKCEILEPFSGGGIELILAEVEKICVGREHLLPGYHINCKHLACKQGIGYANTALTKDESEELLVPFWSVEKGLGRFINRKTRELYSTNRAGKVGKTGQVVNKL